MSSSVWAGGDKSGLECRGGYVDAAVQHGMEELFEGLLVAGGGLSKVFNDRCVCKEDSEHTSHLV